MRYLQPYSVLHRDLQDIGLDDEQIVLIIKKLLRAVPVDEEWYLRTYPDVAVGIENGNTKSAKHHFVTDGYFEGRLPFEHEIDEEWYSTTYPDVAAHYESAKRHYMEYGYRRTDSFRELIL